MIDINTKIENLIKDVVTKLYSIKNINFTIETPKDSTHGDLATNIAMVLTKELKRNPIDIAEQIRSSLLKLESKEILDIEVAKPGFINFKLNPTIFLPIVNEVLEEQDNFGKSSKLNGKTILIEHTSPNPNKAYHIGHLKNTLTGLSVSYLFEAVGAKVFRDAVDNNKGIGISKLMWGYLKFARKNESTPIDIEYWRNNKDKWYLPEEVGIPADKYMADMYVKGNQDAKENPEIDTLVRKMVEDFEANDPANLELWALTQKWVWEGYEKILRRIDGWKFDKIWHESEFYQDAKKVVQEGLTKGIFQKLEDGAILTNLKDFNLTDTIVIKRDGTSLYITQDLELSRLKKEYFKADQMFWVIGPEQSLAMKQMFAVCSQLGILPYEDFHHLAYGFILGKDAQGNPKKISSRTGSTIYVDDLIDSAKEKIKEYIKKDFSEKEKESISEKLAIASIKYSLLKVERLKDIVFDIDTSISIEGDSAPYIIYTYTRAKSILNQYQGEIENIIIQIELTTPEIDLLKTINDFENIVSQAAKEYEPSLIANYIYRLSRNFNNFYNSTPILNSKNKEHKEFRLQLTKATAQVIRNGLNLLGITPVERM